MSVKLYKDGKLVPISGAVEVPFKVTDDCSNLSGQKVAFVTGTPNDSQIMGWDEATNTIKGITETKTPLKITASSGTTALDVTGNVVMNGKTVSTAKFELSGTTLNITL